MTNPLTHDRFWSLVDASGGSSACWPFRGFINNEGYGKIRAPGGRQVHAHRMAYIFAKGTIPPAIIVCHICDNRGCCNPNHLFLGTPTENMRDRDNKGRQARGERQGLATKTEADIQNIFALRKRGLTQQQIADKYGVGQNKISEILLRQTWKHVEVAET